MIKNIQRQIIILSLLICISSVTDAQELSNEEIKVIKKECKKLIKEGWKLKPDAFFDVQLNIGEWMPIIEQTTRPVILFEAYRDLPNGHIEVMAHIGIMTAQMYELLCHANTVPAL